MSKDVDWNEDEIDLKDFPVSQLPDSPSCPILVKLVLQCPRLTIIPPAFFEHMPMLEVLDFSTTNILSLPPSISSLSLLQQLFLRDCTTLIELPTQIGMLTKLKLFNIKGTEIMCLPEEMGNLKDLEVLRVSLSQYANDYVKTRSVHDTVIPRKMISKLKKLEELCISVSPQAEWWDKELEAIQYELCDLANLKTLQWYLPTKGVFHQFLLLERNHLPLYASLSNLMLTIGQHAQLTSCLPRDFEKNFKEFKNCLKWVNAEGNLDDISKIIATTEALFLSRHWTIRNLSALNITNLKYCLLAECNEMYTIVEADGLSEDVETGKKNSEKVGLEMLQYLSISFMEKLTSLVNGPIGKDSFSKLTILALHACPELTSIFTRSIAQNLSCLIELTVEDCPKVTSLIVNQSSTTECSLFHSLKRIFLLDLPELVSIFGGLIILEKLESLLIYNCLKLLYLSMVELPHIQKIQGETKWWKALNYDQYSKWKTIFEPLKEKRDLVQQLFEATNSLQHFHDIESLEYDEKKLFDSTDIRSELMQDDTTEIVNEIVPLPKGLIEGSSQMYSMQSAPPARKTDADEFLNSENDKNDYDWLLTSPATPLFPSLGMKSHKTVIGQIGTPKARPTALKSRLSNTHPEATGRNNMISRQQGSSPGLSSSRVGLRRPFSSRGPGSRPTSSGGPGSRPATPTGRPTSRTKSNSLTKRTSNITSRPTSASSSRAASTTTSRPASTATSRPTRSSTPTSRPTVSRISQMVHAAFRNIYEKVRCRSVS